MAVRVWTPTEVVGRNVRRIRQAKGLTQAELGLRLAAANATARWQSTVAALEQGRRRLDIGELLSLAAALEVTSQSLLWLPDTGGLTVRVGNSSMGRAEWHRVNRVSEEDRWASTGASSGSSGSRSDARFSKSFDRALIKKREETLAKRGKYPGPTFLADRAVTLLLDVGGRFKSTKVPLKLRTGEPYVARDELEATALWEAEQVGIVRRIDRFQARKLRRGLGASS